MIISLVVVPGQPLRITPEPAFIRVGESVSWELSVASGFHIDAIEWSIYFRGADPFRRGKGSIWTHVTRRLPSGVHGGVLDVGPAQEPGEYKYGVRTANANTREELSDDDPYLVVRL